MWTKETLNFLMATGILSTLLGFSSPTYAQSVQFDCATDEQNVPTTYAQTPGGIVQIFKWTSTFFNPPYTPIQRCQEVAKRLNEFQPDHLVAGRVNSYNVICAGTACDRGGANILLTLRPDQNPAQVLAEIDNTRDAAGGPSMQLGGGSNGQKNPQQRTNLFKTSNGSVALNLRGYIQSAPKIPRNLSGESTPNNNRNFEVLEQQPITVPSNTTNPSGSSRGSAW
ncbi:MAG: COP23 domain-containing protein [Crocosphaera sp.]|nr:COP23 domain-containing protein [Crocosphaera sp.]